MPPSPVEEPSHRGSVVDRSTSYVWGHPALRVALIVTFVDHVVAIVMAIAGPLSPAMAGLLALLSVLTWFFAVVLPMMNREVRASVGADSASYWGELVEMFGRVVLVAQTALYSTLLVYALL